MSRGEALSALSSAACALIVTTIDNIFGLDCGQRRERNDHTLDARTGHLSHWLDRIDLPLTTLMWQGLETVNLTLATYGQWVDEGNSIRGTNIVVATLAAYLTATITLLEHQGMDDPRRLTRSVHSRQKPHLLLARFIDQHTIMRVERRTHQPITQDIIDSILWINNCASSTDAFGWTISWPDHYDWMILGFFHGILHR
jgi:hypothetical protein